MSKVYEVIDAIVALLKSDEGLREIGEYHRMNGFTVPRRPTVSVGSEKIKYEEDTRDKDRAEAEIKIYVYLDDRDLERGENTAWELASRIRLVLLSNRLLGGVLDEMFVSGIQAVYAEVSNSNLHACQIDVAAIYYEDRHIEKPFEPIAHLQSDINPEGV